MALRPTLALGLLLLADAARAEPWFTGPLETPGATVNPPCVLTLQPSLALSDGRASYGANGQRIETAHPSYSINPELQLYYGLTERLQGSLSAQAQWSVESGDWASGVGDSEVGLGIALLEQDLESLAPDARLDLLLTLPTGEYQRLDPEWGGSDATGGGSYVAGLRLNTAKTLTFGEHVIRPHASVVLEFYLSRVRVNGANAYGGGYGTGGTVAPGRSLSAYLSAEYALSQRWALALGAIYTRSSSTSFRGESGVLAAGTPAEVGNPRAELLTLAPALEYSWSADRGVIAGMTFDLAGRNASQAIGVQVQYSVSFEAF